jgi:PilZ domain-containing protein
MSVETEIPLTIVTERRRRARLNMIYPGTIDHWNGTIPSVLTMDVSYDGCQVTLPEYCHPGEVVFLDIQVELDQSVRARAVITRCEELHGVGRYTAGLEFHRPNRSLMAHVKRQMRS